MIHSDRIAHAFAYAAKHGSVRSRKGGGTTWPTRPANVAVLLSRYGCDENTIVAGILSAMLNELPPERLAEFDARMSAKFGAIVMEIVRPALEPRFDARGKERTWDACRMEYLAIMAGAEVRVLEVCAADAIHACGGILTDLRRLGVEYLTSYAPGGGSTVVRWFQETVATFERHPRGPRPAMLHDLRDLTTRLADGVAQAG
jgi:(p)ppGpp synthase/HD superfamily hydrolase